MTRSPCFPALPEIFVISNKGLSGWLKWNTNYKYTYVFVLLYVLHKRGTIIKERKIPMFCVCH
jgi:hypothetical protein